MYAPVSSVLLRLLLASGLAAASPSARLALQPRADSVNFTSSFEDLPNNVAGAEGIGAYNGLFWHLISKWTPSVLSAPHCLTALNRHGIVNYLAAPH
jgi:hypothetical protein